MGSPNFVQVAGPGGRVQALTAGPNTQTWIFNPSSLKGTTPGGDFIYASRARVRVTGSLLIGNTNLARSPSWEALARVIGQVRVFSPFLGEIVNKSLNSGPLLANHDSFFVNGFRPITRTRPRFTAVSTTTVPIEYEFEIPFERDYLTRSTDTCPWLPFLEGGIIEIDLAPSNVLSVWGVTLSGTWNCELVIDWFTDKQAIIHAPVQSRLYRVTTSGPEYLLKAVGSPNGLDGVVMGSRLAILSWLMKGVGFDGSFAGPDNGFYSAFAGGGILPATNGITRLDIPWREQVSVDAISAWIGAFLADVGPTRYRPDSNVNTGLGGGPGTAIGSVDLQGWPYNDDGNEYFIGSTSTHQSLIDDLLDFFPLVWTGHYSKISDMQKVDGDLSFTATLTTPPATPVLHLFRSDEICGFTQAKVLDLMDRWGLPHKSRGGSYDFIPKYSGSKRADPTTQWGMPLKIVKAA